jgi:methylenetetrahydrofolate reductase (NADPH)
MASNSELKAAVREFLEGYSIEATPHDAANLKDFPNALAPGARVYVAHPPGMSIDDVADFCEKLRNVGFVPVPHIIARKVETRDQLARALARLAKADIDHALCIAGDIGVENGAFDSSLEVLQTGLLQENGFRHIGIAGHPEGSKAIGDERARQALLDKVAFVKDAPFKTYIVTQFGFDPSAFTDWDVETTKMGIDLPIHVGMAGPASIRQLVRFAAMCGVGASARMLMTRTGATANLLRKQSPDDLITSFARYRLAHPDSKLVGGHFFAFGGVTKAAEWANKVVAGEFEFNSDSTGFKVAG